MHSEKITFKNKEGIELAGRLETPDIPVQAYAIFAHCFTCSKDIAAASRISRKLAAHGFGVLRFDFTGLGNSDGDFANTNFTSNVQDLVAASDFLAQQYEAPKLLIGHSLGGAAVLMAAKAIDSVKAVVTIGAPADASHVIENFKTKISEIETKGQAEVTLAGRKFSIKKQFIDDLQAQEHEDVIGSLGTALLVFHSPQDATVGIENARKIYQQAKHPKSFISLDGADHLLSNRQDSEYVATTIAAWADRYLGLEETKTARSDRLLDPEWQVLVNGSKSSHLTHKIVTKEHLIYADEPKELGGKDLGLSPYDLLLGGLGACTAMTLRMYAQHKKWDLEKVAVYLNHQKLPPKDSENEKIETINRMIQMTGDLDASQRQRLLEIADKCPVHKTLSSNIQILTREDSAAD